MAHSMEHCQRPWWKRPPFWIIVIVAVSALSFVVVEQSGRPAATPYSAFLDQLEAGKVASVRFQGTEISGRYKTVADGTLPAGAGQDVSFRSRVPDFGDPALIPELRKQHVAIDVASPSAWTWLLGRVPWPMLIFVGALLVLGFVRLVRGKTQTGTAPPSLPAHGMMGLVSELFAGRPATGSPPAHDDEPKTR